jgi:hypothetical protein
MKLSFTRGHAYRFMACSLFALGLTLAGCATDAPPPAPPPPPPPAPAGPPVALSSQISDAAAAYVAYVEQARKLPANFGDGASVQSELQIGESYEPTQLARGAVAYAAIVAMQEPSFRSALRAYAADPAARADMVQKLLADPNYAAGLPSANVAARRIILALSTDGQSIYKAGAAVKQSAYDIQHQAWSKEFVNGRDERLALAKQNSVTLKSVESDQSAKLLAAALSGEGLVTRARTGEATGDAAVGGSPLPAGSTAPAASDPAPAASSANPAAAEVADPNANFGRPDLFDQPYTQTVNRALAIAAVAILGEGGDNNAPNLVSLLDEGDGARCLNMSKLNLYQCLAVAKPHYEDVFCLGQHVLMDTGQCLGKMSSNALSFEPVRKIGFNDDGSIAHADAEPYLKPEPTVKCKKGKKCKAAPSGATTKSSSSTKSKKKKG